MTAPAPAVTCTGPSWCTRHSRDCHVSTPQIRGSESVHLVKLDPLPPVVVVGLLDPRSPASARKLARLLAGLGHAELAALVTSTAAMAEGAS